MGTVSPTLSTMPRMPAAVHTSSVADAPRTSGEATSPGAGPSSASSEISEIPAAQPRPQNRSNENAADAQIMPDQIGRETCSICIVDFEEGDEIRMLPCEGKHVFHQQCVDPWLLELSSSCPLCRQDFHALEEMIAASSGHDVEYDEHDHRASHGASRFSRYLRFARGRHGRHRQFGNRDDIFEDPTDPPMPLARDTSL